MCRSSCRPKAGWARCCRSSCALPTDRARCRRRAYAARRTWLTTHDSRLATHYYILWRYSLWRYPPWQALRLSFSENESFLFCGYKLLHFQLPPGFSHAVTFNLVPVRT